MKRLSLQSYISYLYFSFYNYNFILANGYYGWTYWAVVGGGVLLCELSIDFDIDFDIDIDMNNKIRLSRNELSCLIQLGYFHLIFVLNILKNIPF